MTTLGWNRDGGSLELWDGSQDSGVEDTPSRRQFARCRVGACSLVRPGHRLARARLDSREKPLGGLVLAQCLADQPALPVDDSRRQSDHLSDLWPVVFGVLGRVWPRLTSRSSILFLCFLASLALFLTIPGLYTTACLALAAGLVSVDVAVDPEALQPVRCPRRHQSALVASGNGPAGGMARMYGRHGRTLGCLGVASSEARGAECPAAGDGHRARGSS